MPISLSTLLATLSSIFCSRASLLLENLALRHQIGVLKAVRKKMPEINLGGSPVVDLPVPSLGWLALCTCHRQARNGRSLASCRISIVLDLEGAARPTRTTTLFAQGPKSDLQDVPGESRHLAYTPSPCTYRRTYSGSEMEDNLPDECVALRHVVLILSWNKMQAD